MIFRFVIFFVLISEPTAVERAFVKIFSTVDRIVIVLLLLYIQRKTGSKVMKSY